MSMSYSNEKNTLMLISLMKQHSIKKVVVSPGAQNICFVGSLQHDQFFQLYSAPDERSAAYIACGLASESGEPVVLSCTGATASRNYYPALTEAYYRKLPILAVTSTKHSAFIGQNIPQVIDRSIQPKDTVRMSVYIPTIRSKDDEWGAITSINGALLELTHCGGGPVHINLETLHSTDYSISQLPSVRCIRRIDNYNEFPSIKKEYKNIAIFVGSHKLWEPALVSHVESFCEKYNAVVLCDHTSNYKGKYKIIPSLITEQEQYYARCRDIDLLIDMGNVSGAYIAINPKEVWRVNPDGEIKDPFRKLTYIFEMEEISFFKSVNKSDRDSFGQNNYKIWNDEYYDLLHSLKDVPFSNIWMARELMNAIQQDSVVHLAILNSLRSWNFFGIEKTFDCFCNTGGFGIDGPISTVLGGALARPDIIHYLIVGDLAFFYDLNALGNRHFPNSIRILLINNGLGTEFKNYNHRAAQFGKEADCFMAARGHYGNKSETLVRHYAEDLGFKYLRASTKKEFLDNLPQFISKSEQSSVVFEAFTDSDDESEALKIIKTIKTSVEGSTKDLAKRILGSRNVGKIKSVLGK